MHDDPSAGLGTVLNYYRNFAAVRWRDKLPLPGDTSRSIRNVSSEAAFRALSNKGIDGWLTDM